MAITIPQEEYEALMKFRQPTIPQLTMLAKMVGYGIRLRDDECFIKGTSAERWDPVDTPAHNHKLLAALIAKGDCKLFFDDGVDEYFIYHYGAMWEQGPPLAHRANLAETVVEAAVALWCPEEEV